MRGNGVMSAVRPQDYRFKVFSVEGGKPDTFELVDSPKESSQRRLQQCTLCHTRVGIKSFGDVARGNLKSFKRRRKEDVIQAALKKKQNDTAWKRLLASWNE